MDDLKPCPFCGADAKLYGGPMAQESYSVWCQGHLGGRHYLDNLGYREADAIAAWNSRADDAEVLRLRSEVTGMKDAYDRQAKIMGGYARENERLRAEVERLTEAITLIERCYYMEGKNAGWRAAHMDGIARDAQNGDDVAWARRLFPRDNQHLQDARAALKEKEA